MAAGFDAIDQADAGLGTAFAGVAVSADDASTVYYNPAGMALLDGRQFSLGGHAIRRSIKFSDSGGSSVPPAFALVPGSGSGEDAGGSSIAANFYLVMPVGDDMKFGIGVNMPYGFSTEYDDRWIGRFQADKSELRTFNVTPALSMRLGESFSVGAGIDYQRMNVEFSNAYALVGPFFLGSREGLSTIKANDEAWGWNLGAIWQLSPLTRLGATYRSTMKYSLEGNQTVTFFGAAEPSVTGPVRGDLKTPDSLSVSVLHKIDDAWDLLVDVTHTKWSSIQSIDFVGRTDGFTRYSIPFNYDDTWKVATGVRYRMSEQWLLKGGLAFEQSPVKDAANQNPRLPDGDRVWVTIGAQKKMSASSRVDFAYAHIFMRNASIDSTQTQLDPPTFSNANPATASTVQGSYKGSIDVFGIQFASTF